MCCGEHDPWDSECPECIENSQNRVCQDMINRHLRGHVGVAAAMLRQFVEAGHTHMQIDTVRKIRLELNAAVMYPYGGNCAICGGNLQ